jgi:hypothetical protein
MEAIKKNPVKKKLIDDSVIISKYMDYVLEKNEEPKNVFSFCKENKISETDFYAFFGSFEALKQEVWIKFFQNASNTITKEAAFETYSNKNKLLTLYFTLFEILTLNRSYVLFSLLENKEGLKNLKSLKKFRNQFKSFIVDIIESDTSVKNDKITRITQPVFSEGAWIQFLFLLKFWMDDTSKGFEKTDVLIEKSVNTVVDLLDTKPLESLFDLGKFLWKEKMK